MAGNSRKSRPATTPDGRERQIASKAYDLAERQIDDGTASAQVITHFLKAQGSREFVELELIRRRSELIEAQKEALASAQRVESLIGDALAAMKRYTGNTDREESPDELS